YGLTKAIPSLEDEMGAFPLPNYLALGGKGGAAAYDTIMHPGDDWLLGSCKWFAKNCLRLGKIVVGPFFEGFYYGYEDGFKSGLKKSKVLIIRLGKHILAGCADFILAVATIPLLELSALAIHVPFRGLTNLLAKILGTLGAISNIGQSLIYFSNRHYSKNYLASFRLSPLYGFSSPTEGFRSSWWRNLGTLVFNLGLTFPLQVLKNCLVLPIIDTLALGIRLTLALICPLSALITYVIGYSLYGFGTFWDASFGIIFSSSARGVTLLANWIDKQAGWCKQSLLTAIGIARASIYLWGFGEEDKKIHRTVQDKEYYKEEPMRLEKIPHSNSHCLLNTLLEQNATVSPNIIQPAIDNSFYTDLF
ncbi:MAG: hypothetical protein ACHP6H_07495, partial [Legionellales bacterium]